MAWKGREKDPVIFTDLLTILEASRIHTTNQALWQTIQQIILRSGQQKDWTVEQITTIISLLQDNSNTLINVETNLKDATFWTQNDETLDFPSSIQVIAGSGITLDYSVANQVTINASANGVWMPLTDGDVDETDLIFAEGSCIMVFVPQV